MAGDGAPDRGEKVQENKRKEKSRARNAATTVRGRPGPMSERLFGL